MSLKWKPQHFLGFPFPLSLVSTLLSREKEKTFLINISHAILYETSISIFSSIYFTTLSKNQIGWRERERERENISLYFHFFLSFLLDPNIKFTNFESIWIWFDVDEDERVWIRGRQKWRRWRPSDGMGGWATEHRWFDAIIAVVDTARAGFGIQYFAKTL